MDLFHVLKKIRNGICLNVQKIKYKKKFSFGKNIVILTTKIAIYEKSMVRFGNNVIFGDGGYITATDGGSITISDNVTVNRNCIIISKDRIEVGKGTIIGPNVTIYDHDHVFDYDTISRSEYKKAPVKIGENCWIGANVLILKGARIGDHSIIGAGCIICNDIPSHSLVTSNREITISTLRKKENGEQGNE